jgi:hypothetical protein
MAHVGRTPLRVVHPVEQLARERGWPAWLAAEAADEASRPLTDAEFDALFPPEGDD